MTVARRGEYFLRSIESLVKSDDEYSLLLDFDGFEENIDSKDCLKVSDRLLCVFPFSG